MESGLLGLRTRQETPERQACVVRNVWRAGAAPTLQRCVDSVTKLARTVQVTSDFVEFVVRNTRSWPALRTPFWRSGSPTCWSGRGAWLHQQRLRHHDAHTAPSHQEDATAEGPGGGVPRPPPPPRKRRMRIDVTGRQRPETQPSLC